MPSNCVICGNSAMKDPGVSFHRLPSSAERKRQWLAAFDVSEEEWCTHWRVCSRHFPDGNPKAAPHSYHEDQFATMWSLRKRAKLDGSRASAAATTPARQVKTTTNSILSLRATHGALSHPFPVISTTTAPATALTAGSTEGEPRTVHARAPPVLLPVASLPANHHLVGGPITVITGECLKQHGAVVPCSTGHGHTAGSGGIHIHELVVVPEVGPSTDEASSESSGTDESPMMTGARDGGGEVGTRDDCVSVDPDVGDHLLGSRGDNLTVYYSVNAGGSPSNVGHSETTLQRVNHTGSFSSHSVSRVDHTVTTASHTASRTDHSATGPSEGRRDMAVVVQSALLAHVATLENDNRQLRQKLASSPLSPPPPLLGVHATDSSTGRPAEGLPVEVSAWENNTADWTLLSSGATGVDGRCSSLLPQAQLSPGLYRLHFDTQTYFTSQGHSQPHYPYVEVVFRVYRGTCHHRVSLQLSPFSYTTSSHTH